MELEGIIIQDSTRISKSGNNMSHTQIALFRPEIPQNTGNIGRLAFCTGSRLHIIGEPSFSLDEAAVKRAGIDYWHQVDLSRHLDWMDFSRYIGELSVKQGVEQRVVVLSRFSDRLYTDYEYTGNEILLFGRETTGVPDEILEYTEQTNPGGILRIPVFEDCRSLNLANSVSIVLYESLRQRNFPGLRSFGKDLK